jgi:hypothetical protein
MRVSVSTKRARQEITPNGAEPGLQGIFSEIFAGNGIANMSDNRQKNTRASFALHGNGTPPLRHFAA